MPPRAAVDDIDAQLDELVEVALPAVRAIVGVAMRSLAASPVPITVAQYRMLATMAQAGPARAATLAELLDVDASTITRMADRLVRDGLVVRDTERGDRRAVRLALSAAGTGVVEAVAHRRREEFAALLRAIPVSHRAGAVAALKEIELANRTLAPTPAPGWIA